jgi:tyrosine-protein phosphatase YwqE
MEQALETLKRQEFVDDGMLVQLTAASVDGRLGKRARRRRLSARPRVGACAGE